MRSIVIIICKLLIFVGKCVNRGTSLPGKVALRLMPGILDEIRLPDNVVAVTGSNGKTSTVEMIAYVLENSGRKVIWNKEGSNQIEGVTTLLIKNSTLTGRVKGDIVVFESDERYARHTFKYIKPTHFIITNLYRDQLTRNVHPFWIYDIIKDAVDLIPESTLLLNGDDPIISRFGIDRENVAYFGMEKNEYSPEHTDALYNDCYYCPVCKSKMNYDFFHYAHLGGYHCEECGYSRPEMDYRIDDADFGRGFISVNTHKVDLEFVSKYNAYNICAAYAICNMLGVSDENISECLSSFVMKNGRVIKFKVGNNDGMLITSKHENSTSYNQSLEYITADKDKSMVVVIVDAISRKYYTTETSWIWDISFEMLKAPQIKTIVLAGKYAYDLAVRINHIDFEDKKIIIENDFQRLQRLLEESENLKVYAVTCFSDKDKLCNIVDVQRIDD